MEQEILNNNEFEFQTETPERIISTEKPFIQANTVSCSLTEIRDKHIIPVFIKDNEPVISHHDFIDTTMEVIQSAYPSESILMPSIRLSHPIKGRVPEAREKPAKELFEHEKTLYYERMAFIIEIPSICDEIDGNRLSLTVGGVKAYNLDNLYNKKGADEHFKIFIGFKNTVCTNLCVWTDGFIGDLKVKSHGHLKGCIRNLIDNYNAVYQIHAMRKLVDYSLTEQQFALMMGRCRMYNHLPNSLKQEITPLLLSDTQLGAVVKDYFRDSSFCKDDAGNINLWRVYNLLTGSNKSSYIDTFLDRSVNSYRFVEEIRWAVDKKESNWFLN
jgi:hypothetical protein